MAGDVSLQCQTDRPLYPVTGSDQAVHVLLEIRPAEIESFTRTPVNLCLVVDRSGSMTGEKIDSVKKAVAQILDRLGPDDYISLVLFNERSLVALPAQNIQDIERLKARIGSLQAEGGTSMSKGMQDGLDELRKHTGPTRTSRMLLLTDGQTWEDEADCKHLASECQLSDITITALGVGEDWNETLLDAIARNSSGRADYVDSPEKIISNFEDELYLLQNVAIQGTSASIHLSKGVTPRRIYRVIPDIIDLSHTASSDRDISVELGTVDKQNGQTLLLELGLPARPAGRYRIAQAEIAYTVPGEAPVSESVTSDIIIQTSDNKEETRTREGTVMNIIERVTAFQLQLEAREALATGKLDVATVKLREAATHLLDMGENELAAAASEEADNLENQGEMSSTGTKKLQYGTRKLTQRLSEEG